MTSVTCDLSVSVDGFVAGPRQTQDNPLGEGGMRLHEWHFDATGEDQRIIEEWQGAPGAYVMGRNMFGPGRGAWDLDWRGWWGDEPPYGVPVFVLTHHEREPLTMGATTFHFVTDGVEGALEQARHAAADRPVAVSGGASTVNQFLAHGLIEELHLHIAPVVLGAGERLFDGLPQLELEPVQVVASPLVTHLKYRVLAPAR
ncbi:MAG: dihydrofolate reductase family protein [Actinomycetota bacterium]|nr:dihydrofolate reductase family protein [Actinomycetota bacterium]